MFTKKVKEEIFNSIIKQSQKVVRKELNERAEKLEDAYESIRYSITEKLIQNAKVSVDRNMVLSVDLELNKNIPFEDTEKQNIPMVLEKGGGIKVKDKRPALVGGRFLQNIFGVKL